MRLLNRYDFKYISKSQIKEYEQQGYEVKPIKLYFASGTAETMYLASKKVSDGSRD